MEIFVYEKFIDEIFLEVGKGEFKIIGVDKKVLLQTELKFFRVNKGGVQYTFSPPTIFEIKTNIFIH